MPVLVKLPLIADFANANPMLLFAGIELDVKRGFLGGFPLIPTIDPNVGYIRRGWRHSREPRRSRSTAFSRGSAMR